jgi:23S rRNA maturation mini-RNase III
MAAPRKIDADLLQERAEAWVGDAVLALYMRRLILREQGRMDGEMFTRCTSNDFLRNIGNPTSVEALIGRIFEEQGLDAAFAWMQQHLLPVFRQQEKNFHHREAQKPRKRSKKNS